MVSVKHNSFIDFEYIYIHTIHILYIHTLTCKLYTDKKNIQREFK